MRDYDGQLWLLEAFAQMQYKVKKRYSVNLGLHSQHAIIATKHNIGRAIARVHGHCGGRQPSRQELR